MNLHTSMGNLRLGNKAISAIDVIRTMHGGSQSHLMLCEDATLCVVKFRTNPQHQRTLVNEFIVTRICESIGLSVPKCHVVNVPATLIATVPTITINHCRLYSEPCSADSHFGSQYAGGLMPGLVMDALPDIKLDAVSNLAEFAGILAVDKWTCNCDTRQAVFQRKPRQKKYRVLFIDNGFCFNGGEWAFPDKPIAGVYEHRRVYHQVTGWNSFEPWLSRIEAFTSESLWQIVTEIPGDWYSHNLFAIEQLIESLVLRRPRVRELINRVRLFDPTYFTKWRAAPLGRPNLTRQCSTPLRAYFEAPPRMSA